MVTTLKALLNTALDLQRSYDQCLRPVIFKYSKAFASLPDELLLLIFQFAALSSSDETKHAVRISHVSRKFRAIALGEHRFWTTLHTSAKKDELDTFLSRSGQDTDLRDVVYINTNRFILKDFMDVCCSTAPRWKSLAVVEAAGMRSFGPTANSVLEIMDRRYDLHFLRLHELHVDGSLDLEEMDEHGVQGGRFKPAWFSPNLRILRCKYFLPLPSPAFSSLSSLATSIYISDDYRDRLREFYSFLYSTPTITELDFQISGVCGDVEHVNMEPPEFGQITSFKFSLPSFDVGTDNSGFVASLMKTLLLPNLDHLCLSVDFRAIEIMDGKLSEDRSAELLAELAHALLPDPVVHRKLTALTFKLTCRIPGPGEFMRQRTLNLKMLPRTFTIPLDEIPRVSSLTLSTFTRAVFTRNETSAPSGLRELRFKECESLVGGEVERTVQSLKDVGAWHNLERFVVEDCKALEYGVALDVIGREKLRYIES